MKKRFSGEQIITILPEAEVRVSAQEFCHKHTISDATFYTCRKRFSRMEVSEVNRHKSSERKTSGSRNYLPKSRWIRRRFRWLRIITSGDKT
nr:transposase [Enterobacter cloacae]